MDKQRQMAEAELLQLGFSFINENTLSGRVPQDGDVHGVYIQVEISLTGFPIKQPEVRLNSINDDSELYKSVPKTWRHLDEFIFSSDPKSTKFYICSMHNWSARSDRGGKFIYERILSWLQSNVTNNWNVDEDLPTWRIIPQFSNAIMYLPDYFLQELRKEEAKTFFSMTAFHTPYVFTSGGEASGKKEGNSYPINEISFQKRIYYFFPESPKEHPFTHLMKAKLGDAFISSKLLLVRLPGNYLFKTLYQLLKTIQQNTDLNKILEKSQNMPVIVMYRGDKGRDEAVAFLASKEYIEGKEDFQIHLMKLESMPKRPMAIDMTVGLLGVGSLGSQVARLLSQKETRRVVMSDPDVLSMENIGRHELSPFYLGHLKSRGLAFELNTKTLSNNFFYMNEDEKVIGISDILVITVGDRQAFDKLAFRKLLGHSKPIIWAWSSPNNILQEIVITTSVTGCLNCYYALTESDKELATFQKIALEEIKAATSIEFDICGNPHTISQMEKMDFLATQIVSILSYYSRHGRFPFDFVNYYWRTDEIIPRAKVGYVQCHPACTCKGDR